MRPSLLVMIPVFLIIFMLACAPVQKEQAPASKTEPSEAKPAEKPATGQKQEITAEVKELLDKPKTRVKSIYYKYRGPQTGSDFYEFYVKGNKIKYKPALEIRTLDQKDSYDSIFIDKISKTAQSYCIATYCLYKGKKADLSYGDAYISTVFDWIGVMQAKKIGEEVIDDRNVWKIETNKGVLWVDTFYGIPLRAESGGEIYMFEQISVNSVQDSDVVPS